MYTSIRNMHETQDLREALTEEFWKRANERRERAKQFEFTRDVLDILKADDPAGWEAWFDAHITNDMDYSQIVQAIANRIIWLEGEKYIAALCAELRLWRW